MTLDDVPRGGKAFVGRIDMRAILFKGRGSSRVLASESRGSCERFLDAIGDPCQQNSK